MESIGTTLYMGLDYFLVVVVTQLQQTESYGLQEEHQLF
jgi:hypothetical protein